MMKISSNLNKMEFCDIINQLREATDLCNQIYKMFNKVQFIDRDFLDPYGLCINHENLVVRLLEKIMHDQDETISWWIYEADYGRDNTMHIYVDKKPIDLSSPELLYDFLMKEG